MIRKTGPNSHGFNRADVVWDWFRRADSLEVISFRQYQSFRMWNTCLIVGFRILTEFLTLFNGISLIKWRFFLENSWSTRLAMLRFRNSTNSKYDRVLFCELRFEWLRLRNLKLLLKRFLLIIKWVVKWVFIHNTYVFFTSFIYDSNKWRRKWRSLFETIFNQVLTF